MYCSWSDCSKHFNDKHDFKEHVKIHAEESTDYRCHWSTCSVKRDSRIGIASHLDVHIPFASFKCSHCLDKFKRMHDLKRHIQGNRCRVLKQNLKTSPNQQISPLESQKKFLDSPSTESMKSSTSKRPKRAISSKRIDPVTQIPTTRPKRKRIPTTTKSKLVSQPSPFHDTFVKKPYSEYQYARHNDQINIDLFNVAPLHLLSTLIHQEILKLEHQ